MSGIDISSLNVLLEDLRNVSDLIKAMVATHDAGVVKAKAQLLTGLMDDLQERVLMARAQLSQVNVIQRELVAHHQKMEKWQQERASGEWERKKARYALTELAPGVFVYQLKEEARAGEPMHSVCPRCYECGGYTFILQTEKQVHPTGLTTVLVCSHCEREIVLEGHREGTRWDALLKKLEDQDKEE